MQFAVNILLTGAGFTKTFGGFLGSEMWAAIFNQPEVRADKTLRERMLEGNLNYEAIYEHVITSPDSEFNTSQKSSFSKAVRKAYGDMDQQIYERRLGDKTGSVFSCCNSFIGRFSRIQNTRAFFFTLNQDILVERFFSTSDTILSLPGLNSPKWFNDKIGNTLLPDEYVTVLDETEVEKEKQKFWDIATGKFMYVKLHGSYGWRAKDGSDVMILGHGKKGRIEKEPLLRWYVSLFEQSLQEGNKNLVIIGYGFGDDHINDIIADAVRDKGLKLFVISPQRPADFRKDLSGVHGTYIEFKHRAEEIWKGLYGYHPGKVTDFYRASQSGLPSLGHDFFRDLGIF
jgi:hypothetical protein